MEKNQQQSLDIVKSFFSTKEHHDLDSLLKLFADNIVYTFPLSASGEPKPWFVYDGKEATKEYQQKTLERFSRLHMVNPVYTVSADGNVVFVESKGDYIQAEGDKPYTNVYIFKFVIREGQIAQVLEYANPVTFAKLANLPIG